MIGSLNTEAIDVAVVNRVSGRVIAVFLLRSDAEKYVAQLDKREGCHGADYEVVILTEAIGSMKC
jgi:hypothetical protein